MRREDDLERNRRAVMIQYENLTAKVDFKEHLDYRERSEMEIDDVRKVKVERHAYPIEQD